MNGFFVTEKDYDMFKSEVIEQSELLRSGNKITFEFYVNSDGKDTFLQWIKILSSVEFNVDVNLDDIHIKEFTTDHKRFNRELKYETDGKLVFRIKVSGKEKDINRWNDNLCQIANFLRGNYDIIHFKNIKDKGQEV